MIIDDMNGIIDDIQKILKSMGVDPNLIKKGGSNVEIQGFIKGPDGKVKDISGILKKMDSINPFDIFGVSQNMFETKEKEIQNVNHDKNIFIIDSILKKCGQKNILNVFNSINFDNNKNRKILSNINIFDKQIIKIIETYNIDLNEIDNKNKFLQCLKYAINKKQIIL